MKVDGRKDPLPLPGAELLQAVLRNGATTVKTSSTAAASTVQVKDHIVHGHKVGYFIF